MPRRTTLKIQAGRYDRTSRYLQALSTMHREAASAVELRKAPRPSDADLKDWIQAGKTLAQLSEQLLRTQVALALSYGMTWKDIGDALGLSRQAAWERYRPRVGEESEPDRLSGIIRALVAPALPARTRMIGPHAEEWGDPFEHRS